MSVDTHSGQYTGTESILIASYVRLKHWYHMTYFNNVFTTFLCLERVSYMLSTQGQKKLPDFIKTYLNLCSEDEWRSYVFEQHEGE